MRAFKPRMLRPVGRKADGWLPSLGVLTREEMRAANEQIDAATRSRDCPSRPPLTKRTAGTAVRKTPRWDGNEKRQNAPDRLRGDRIKRHDFGVSWQDGIPGGGMAVSNEIELALDAEAIVMDELERTGAMDHYRR